MSLYIYTTLIYAIYVKKMHHRQNVSVYYYLISVNIILKLYFSINFVRGEGSRAVF